MKSHGKDLRKQCLAVAEGHYVAKILVGEVSERAGNEQVEICVCREASVAGFNVMAECRQSRRMSEPDRSRIRRSIVGVCRP